MLRVKDPGMKSVGNEAGGFESALFRRATGLGLCALFSRLLGLLRDMGIAWLLGAGAGADMLLAAMRLPHLLRRLLADGSLSMSLTSILASRGKGGSAALYAALRWRFALLLAILTAVLIVLASRIMEAFAPGFGPVELENSAKLLQLCLPYVFTAGMAALGMAFLHSRENFLAPAISPLVFNLVLILFTGLAAFFAANAIWIIAIGMAFAGCCQWLVQAQASARQFRRAWRPEAARPRTDGLSGKMAWASLGMLPAGIVGAAAPQLLMLCAMRAASEYGPGHISALYYAERLLELPMGLVVAGINMASLPALSRLASQGKQVVFEKNFLLAMRWTLLLSMAAAAGLLSTGPLLVDVLLEHGAFDNRAAGLTWTTLALLAPALPVLGFNRCLLSVCNSLHLFGHACLSAIIAFLAALGFARILPLALPEGWGHFVPALAYDLALVAQACSLLALSPRGMISIKGLFSTIPERYFLDAILAATATSCVALFCRRITESSSLALFSAVVGGVAAFSLCLLYIERRNTWDWLRRATRDTDI